MLKKFGFYPYQKTFQAGPIRIFPIDDLQDCVRYALTSGAHFIDDGWCHPRIVKVVGRNRFNQKLVGVVPVPRTLAVDTRFELEPTHWIEHKQTASEARLNFLVACFGLFVGMRLLPDGWGHFCKTPIYEGMLSDVTMHDQSIGRSLSLADDFWVRQHRNGELLLNIQAAINSYHEAQCHEYDHEKFIFMCMAMDTVLRVYQRLLPLDFPTRGPNKVDKWSFPGRLSRFLGVPCPRWARKLPGKRATIASRARNALIHEAEMDGKPFGHSVYTPYGISLHDINLEMVGLITRGLMYALGIRSDYLRTAITARMHHLAKVK